jgi:hypothetical protein
MGMDERIRIFFTDIRWKKSASRMTDVHPDFRGMVVVTLPTARTSNLQLLRFECFEDAMRGFTTPFVKDVGVLQVPPFRSACRWPVLHAHRHYHRSLTW